MAKGLPGRPRHCSGPCLSCGCEAVGPFLINRELLLTVLSFIYLCVMFGSRTSVKLTGVLLKLKMKATEMAAAAASSRALALRQSPCPVLNQEFSQPTVKGREAGSSPVSVDAALAAAHLMEMNTFLLVSNDRVSG